MTTAYEAKQDGAQWLVIRPDGSLAEVLKTKDRAEACAAVLNERNEAMTVFDH